MKKYNEHSCSVMVLLSHFRSTQHPGDQRQHSQLYHDKVSQAIFSRACPWLVSSPACCIQLLPSLLGTWPYFASLYIPHFFFPFFHAIFLFILFAHLTFFHFFSRRLIFFRFKKKKKKSLAQPISIHYPVGPRVFSLFFRFHSYALRSSSWIWVTES